MSVALLFVISVIVFILALVFFVKGLRKKQDRKIRGIIFLLSMVFFIYMLAILPGGNEEKESENEDPEKEEKLAEKEKERKSEYDSRIYLAFEESLGQMKGYADSISGDSGQMYYKINMTFSEFFDSDYYDFAIYLPEDIDESSLMTVDLKDDTHINFTFFDEDMTDFPVILELYDSHKSISNWSIPDSTVVEKDFFVIDIDYTLENEFDPEETYYFILKRD